MRNAGCPKRSTDTPMIRPGKWRLNDSRAAKKAACGPPYPMGTPNRWELPTTTSAPMAPGLFNTSNAIKSAAKTVRTSRSAMPSTNPVKSSTSPLASGYWTRHPKTSPASTAPRMASRVITTMSMSRWAARVRSTLRVWGNTASSTKNRFLPALTWGRGRAANNIAIASAAAVPSSSKEALATSIPVKSMTMVWKFSSASKRPCAISAW